MTLNRNFKTPCYAVIFSYQRSENLSGYQQMDEITLDLVKQMDGFLGYEVTGNGAEHAIFISYWQTLEAIENWKNNQTHLQAKHKGKTQWYNWYHSIICKVEKSHYHQLKK